MPKEYNNFCPVCGDGLNDDNVARRENDQSVRIDAFGWAWCIKCTNKFDQEEHGSDG
jgi:hypothetical protein